MPRLPSILCLCPTYGRPRLLANAVSCFFKQDYPGRRTLLILDDAAQYGGDWFRQMPPFGEIGWDGHCQLNFLSDKAYWQLYSADRRFASLPEKYKVLLNLAGVYPYRPSGTHWDIVCNWDDDDIYLPNHLMCHANILNEDSTYKWSYPQEVYKLDDPHGRLKTERIDGNMWASCAYRSTLLREIGGFPQTRQASFDLQFLGLLRKHGGNPGRSSFLSFVFRWQTTKHPHMQGYIRSHDDVEQYAKFPQHDKTFVERLEPLMDEETFHWYQEFYHGTIQSRIYNA